MPESKDAPKVAREPKLRHLSLWIWAFLINLGLQVFRGSVGDTVIFSIFSILLIFASRSRKNTEWLNRLRFKYVIELSLVIGALIIVTPWHTGLIAGLFIVLLLLVLVLIWTREHTERAPRDRRIKRAELLWISWAVGLALWEFAANLLGIFNDNLYEFPTISVLVDPMLDSWGGQAAFVSLWMALGIGLLRLVRQR
ncbi:MAG: hypothetical protein ACKOWE_01930 [Micrococcales bacterium]